MPVERFLRLARPLLDEDELAELREVLASGYLTQGPKLAEFERLVAQRVGTPHAVATTSATTALHLSLVALGIGPGDEVLLPDFTFPATANVVVQQGARPVLVDIDLDTFTMRPDDLAAKITPRSKAVIPVHAFGLSADMGSILEIARAHGLAVIEDAACAIGATYYGKPCGSFGATGCFSFHPRKVITTGEGGMITTSDDRLAGRLRMLRSHGGVKRHHAFAFEAAGFNYRLSDVQAALGVAQMRKLDRLIAAKRQLAAAMARRLEALGGVRAPGEPPWGGHVFQSYVVLLDEALDRDAVVQAMREQGIETTLGTYALHAQPFFARQHGYRPGDVPDSYRAYRHSLTLPLYAPMEEGDVDRVVAALRAAMDRQPSRAIGGD
ncbi:MAG: DegT/DnrJ/EryC1/StrS family aminotransferase [Thermoguttaceae bacterium]